MAADLRFLLAIDDGGEFLVAFGERLVIGHSRSRRADLPFLADVAPEHAELRFAPDSFHEGAHWSLAPLAAPSGTLRVNGGELAAVRRLAHGDAVQLSPQLGLRFAQSDPASSSAVLELERGAECLGAQRILLLAPGAGGRIHVGRRTIDHVRVSRLETQIEIELAARELLVSALTGLRIAGSEPASRARLACPPTSRVDLALQKPSRNGPPFVISVSPLEASGP